MDKNYWVSHHMKIILTPIYDNKRSITYSLSETIATNIFIRPSITYGELKELVNNPEKSRVFDGIKVIAPIQTLDDEEIAKAICNIYYTTNKKERDIRIKLFLTQLFIVFINKLINVTKDKIFKEYDNCEQEEGSYCTVSG